MANWAIVVGVDGYWKPEVSLKGAVRDALLMRDWLLSPDGGNVKPRNLFLLLGPQPGVSVPTGTIAPTKDNIVRTLDLVLRKSEGEGERFYFYFAGHGLSMEAALGSYEQALIAADFDYVVADHSIELASLLDYFKNTAFADQFFFIDACRNVPERRFRVGTIPSPPPRDPMRAEPQQFVLYATSPGVKAAEAAHVGGEGGVFTDALLAGLAGWGNAKTYDGNADCHVVRWRTLFDFVKGRLEARKITFGSGAALIQIPREAGERGVAGRDSNPELGRFPTTAFAAMRLEVFVEPAPAISLAEIAVYENGETVPAQAQKRPAAVPVPFDLPPRGYWVRASADGYRPRRKSWFIELYDPGRVDVALDPAPPAPPPAAPLPASRSPQPPEGVPAGLSRIDRFDGPIPAPGGMWRSIPPPPPPAERLTSGAIIVTTADPLAWLELLDLAGQSVASGNGRIEQHGLRPGGYRARLVTPEGQTVEEVVDLMPTRTAERVTLLPPPPPATPAMTEAMFRSGFWVDDGHALHVSERLGSLASAQLSTIVALAGVLATYPPPDVLGMGGRLYALGLGRRLLRGYPTDGAVLYLVLADEQPRPPADAGSEAASAPPLRLALSFERDSDGARDAMLLPRRVPESPAGVLEASLGLRAGPVWLTVATPDRGTVTFPLVGLPGYATFPVFHRTTEGGVYVFLFTPPLAPADASAEGAIRALNRTRHLELIQRQILAGEYGHAGDPATLLADPEAEPILRLLATYLLLRAGRIEEAAAAAGEMAERFDWWSDVHVILGECLAARGRSDEAAAEYQRALDGGIPIFAGGLSRLADAVRRHALEHPNRALLERTLATRVPGLLWVACTPRA